VGKHPLRRPRSTRENKIMMNLKERPIVRMGGDGDGSGSFPFMCFCISGAEFLGFCYINARIRFTRQAGSSYFRVTAVGETSREYLVFD
jgi:hypothetical protein